MRPLPQGGDGKLWLQSPDLETATPEMGMGQNLTKSNWTAGFSP